MSVADFQHWARTLSTADKLTLIATIATLVAVSVAIWQLRETNKTSRGQFWLMLRSVMTQYDDIHANFRPLGKWHASATQPDTVNDWARTELYMGLLEYCDKLIEDGLLDHNHFRDWYKYRVNNLLANPGVVTYKLHDNASGWREFRALCKKLGIDVPPATKSLSPFIREEGAGYAGPMPDAGRPSTP